MFRLGTRRFMDETGIKVADWHGKYWVRWSDAISEAGLVPNGMTSAYNDDELLAKLALFIKELDVFR